MPISDSVKLKGKVTIHHPGLVNLYGCEVGDGSLVSRARIPAGEICAGKYCWKPNSKGFKYGDKEATPDGITQLQLKEGLEPGKAQIMVKGKGLALDMPALDPVASPVQVQLRNLAGTCWESIHSAPFKKQDGNQLNDASD